MTENTRQKPIIRSEDPEDYAHENFRDELKPLFTKNQFSLQGIPTNAFGDVVKVDGHLGQRIGLIHLQKQFATHGVKLPTKSFHQILNAQQENDLPEGVPS